MPTYEFQCPNCGAKIQQRRSFDDNSDGPTCGDCLVIMTKTFSATPAIFKGDGWGATKK